jgi:kynurenine formamidase
LTRVIDLTAVIQEGMIQNHPTHPRAPLLWTNQVHWMTQHYFHELWEDPPPLSDGLPPEIGQADRGHGWQSEQLLIGTHTGTHIDAGVHFDTPPCQDAADIPLEAAIGSALLLDLRPWCSDNHRISSDELDDAELQTNDKVRPGDIVILNTGHAERHLNRPGATAEEWADTQPGLDYYAHRWFIDRNVRTVGIDVPNIDCDMKLVTHINFLMRGRIGKDVIQIVENLVNLAEIPRPRFEFVGLPLPIRNGGGSPIRAIAMID